MSLHSFNFSKIQQSKPESHKKTDFLQNIRQPRQISIMSDIRLDTPTACLTHRDLSALSCNEAVEVELLMVSLLEKRHCNLFYNDTAALGRERSVTALRTERSHSKQLCICSYFSLIAYSATSSRQKQTSVAARVKRDPFLLMEVTDLIGFPQVEGG